jgi:hypothetical protein
MSDTVKNQIQALIDRETLGLNTKILTRSSTSFIQTWFGHGRPHPATTTRFGGNLCWGDFKETGGGNISRRFLTNTIWFIMIEEPLRSKSHPRKMPPLQFWILTRCGATRTQSKRLSGRAGFVSFTPGWPAATGSLFSRQVRWIMREPSLPESCPMKTAQTAEKSGEPVTIPSRKRHMFSWTGAACVLWARTSLKSPSNSMRRTS